MTEHWLERRSWPLVTGLSRVRNACPETGIAPLTATRTLATRETPESGPLKVGSQNW